MEVTPVGVRTRARAMAVMAVAEENTGNSAAVKRRKLGNENLKSASSTFVQTKTVDCEISVNSTPEEEAGDSVDAGVRSGGVPASCCSGTGSIEKLKVPDLEVESDAIETAPARYNIDGIESTPASEIKEESGEKDTVKQSPVTVVDHCRTVLPVEKMPPESELEEFFAAAQEDLNKRFKSKYNYDIVNDIPLKGRFDWIEVSQKNEDEDHD